MKLMPVILILIWICSCGSEINKGTLSLELSVNGSVQGQSTRIEPALTIIPDRPMSESALFVDCYKYTVDLKFLEARDENGTWFVIKDENSSGLVEFPGNGIHGANIAKTLLSEGKYNAFLFAFKTDWALEAIYTNADVGFGRINYINNSQYPVRYFLFTINSLNEPLMFNNRLITNAVISIIREPLTLKKGEEKSLSVLFNTVGVVEAFTNRNGIVTNFLIHSPSFTLQVK